MDFNKYGIKRSLRFPDSAKSTGCVWWVMLSCSIQKIQAVSLPTGLLFILSISPNLDMWMCPVMWQNCTQQWLVTANSFRRGTSFYYRATWVTEKEMLKDTTMEILGLQNSRMQIKMLFWKPDVHVGDLLYFPRLAARTPFAQLDRVFYWCAV